MMKYFEMNEQRHRRDVWFDNVRDHIYGWVNPDGSSKIPQFDAPWREVIWVLPALYSGTQKYIDLANLMLGSFNSPAKITSSKLDESHGKQFAVFQSNCIATNFNAFGHLMSDTAKTVSEWHCNALFRNFDGSAQPDYKFHGANDNMPMMGTTGLILGGESLGNEQAVKHGYWNLQQVRRHLSRCAWMSEFNSSTYSPITLCNVARIATLAKNENIRQLALEIEHRIWAEILLHYHPSTKMQAGPHQRAYSIDSAGHNHSLQALLWLAFGAEKIGRDIMKSYFSPDGTEVVHFGGNYAQSIAEFTDMFDCELHMPEALAELIEKRSYPVHHKGRSEVISTFDSQSGTVYTTTYMEEDFSLGSSTIPLCGGEQTNQLYATYKYKPKVKTFRDASTMFYRYFIDNSLIGEQETSVDGNYHSDIFQPNQAWCYTMQKDNVGLLSLMPNLSHAPLTTDTLKLAIAFPAHYGSISRIISNNGNLTFGDELVEPEPISLEGGEVFINIIPLLPTNLPRRAALRFSKQHKYEVLELINYEGELREFSRSELAQVLNGMVMTIESKSKYSSLEAFHREKSACIVQDYLFVKHRFLQVFRDDVDFELVYTPEPFGIQTETIDGRPIERPMFESNQLNVNTLPFLTGKVERNFPFFPWNKLDCISFENSWLIGSRGLDGEKNYSNRSSGLKNSI
jgi:hypothetical protein